MGKNVSAFIQAVSLYPEDFKLFCCGQLISTINPSLLFGGKYSLKKDLPGFSLTVDVLTIDVKTVDVLTVAVPCL